MRYIDHTYTITVGPNVLEEDGMDGYTSTVLEFPDVAEYADTPEKAFELIAESIAMTMNLHGPFLAQ